MIGDFQLAVNGNPLLDAAGRNAPRSAAVELSQGRHPIHATFTKAADQPACVNLWWESSHFAREPVPWAVLSHDPDELDKIRSRPAVWFPYNKMGTSSSGIVCDLTAGKFGPFTEQLFIGDQEFPILSRVALEKVQGEYQGACFPFRKHFPSGTNALTFAEDGSMFVGETDRGWGSVGRRSWGLTRILHTGETPFEMLTMKLRTDAFDLTFTKPVDRAKAVDPAAYSLQDYWYKYQKRYGSDEEGHRPIKVLQATVSPDGKTVTLKTEPLQTDRVVELHLAKDYPAADGTPILHPDAYYTLNQMP